MKLFGRDIQFSSNKRGRRRNRGPTVMFDSTLVTDEVLADLRRNVSLLKEIDQRYFEKIYKAALKSIVAGRALNVLYDALMQMEIEGMTARRAEKITLSLCNKANVEISRRRELSLGIEIGIWLYSGAPCIVDSKCPTDHDMRQDEAHRAANGKKFKIRDGISVGGQQTWPGREDGCRVFGSQWFRASAKSISHRDIGLAPPKTSL